MKQHYLPATFLANFSDEQGGRRRRRMIAVADKHEGRCWTDRAENVAFEKDFYSVDGDDPNMLERIWAEYETELADAIDQLLSGSIDATTWAGVLVPFVASMLVRGPDFDERFEARLAAILPEDVEIGPDNTNLARTIELQRLLAPILAARWVVAEVDGDTPLITNDVGFVGFGAPQVGKLGLAIPLTKRHVLQLFPERRRSVAHVRGDRYFPEIQYVSMASGNHLQLNHALAPAARRFFFGHHTDDLASILESVGSAVPPPLEPFALGFASGPLARVHEFMWHHLVSVLARPPEDPIDQSVNIDFRAVASMWKPVVVLPSASPIYPPGLRRDGDSVIVDLYEIPGVTDRQ